MDRENLINTIVWIKQNLMFEVAAINLLFSPQGRQAVAAIPEPLFGIPGKRMTGSEFIKYLESVSRDLHQYDSLNSIPSRTALLDLHEEIKLQLAENEYKALKNEQWFRALYHLRNAIGHDKIFRFMRKKNGELGYKVGELLPANYEPIHCAGKLLTITEQNEGKSPEISENDVYSIIDEAQNYFSK